MPDRRIRRNVSEESDQHAADMGMTIDEIVKAHKESLDPVLRGGLGLGPDASSKPASGPRPNPSTPRQTESNDTTNQGPTDEELRRYCATNAHLEAHTNGTHHTDLDGPGIEGQPIIRVYCARCTTTTTHRSNDTNTDAKTYTFTVREPTPLHSYHSDQ